jgi:hypothetical protein
MADQLADVQDIDVNWKGRWRYYTWHTHCGDDSMQLQI